MAGPSGGVLKITTCTWFAMIAPPADPPAAFRRGVGPSQRYDSSLLELQPNGRVLLQGAGKVPRPLVVGGVCGTGAVFSRLPVARCFEGMADVPARIAGEPCAVGRPSDVEGEGLFHGRLICWESTGASPVARKKSSTSHRAYEPPGLPRWCPTHTSSSIRSGFSTQSLMRTRNCTASLPSINRWS